LIEKASPRRRSRWLRGLSLATAFVLAVLARGYCNATRDPIIRSATIELAGWPDDAPPLRVLHLSDIHVAGPDMPPKRLQQLVQSVNQLRPDLVTIGGDLVSEKRTATRIYSAAEVVRPLGGLRARLGVIVAPGNHNHRFDMAAIERELARNGITVLANQAVRRGPLIIGGVDDHYSGHDDVPATLAAMDVLGPGPHILLTHSPDIVPGLSRPVGATLAGHTHCGQIALPVIGALSYVSRYGDRFACGVIHDVNGPVVVGAGLGTSIVPLRYGAPPDAWLLTLRGPQNRMARP
jgi:uncharacterized protein